MTTKLEAVNRLLHRIKTRQLGSLEELLNEDHLNAIRSIDQTLLEVLMEGWRFNTDRDFPLTPDDDGYLQLPETSLSWELSRCGVDPRDYTERRGRIYNNKTRSDVFTSGLTLKKIIHNMDFEDVPPVAREYIAIKAERIFMFNITRDSALSEPAIAENEFRAKMVRMDLKDDAPNMFRNRSVRETAGELY